MKTSYAASTIDFPNHLVVNDLNNKPNDIKLSFPFSKISKSSIISLLVVILLVEVIFWGFALPEKQSIYARYPNIWYYGLNFIVGFVIPECFTLFILSFLIKKHHAILGFTKIKIDTRSVLFYELSFLPLLLTSFFVFFPVTLHVRYALRSSIGMLSVSYTRYISDTLTWQTYLTYLPFVLILGYILINMSLFNDFLRVTQHSLEKATAQLAHNPIVISTQEVIAEVRQELKSSTSHSEPQIHTEYKRIVSARDSLGDVILKVEECCCFEADGKNTKAYHTNGKTYRINGSILSLEQSLDPALFFRGSRSAIINLHFVRSYCYWEKGKYTIYIDSPDNKEVVIPRTHIQAFKEALEKAMLHK